MIQYLFYLDILYRAAVLELTFVGSKSVDLVGCRILYRSEVNHIRTKISIGLVQGNEVTIDSGTWIGMK